MEPTPRVVDGIGKLFPEEQRDEVTRMLVDSGMEETVQIAILKLARGQITKIPDLIKAAKSDYRDVLAWSQQPIRVYIVGILRRGPNWTRFTHLHHKNLKSWKAAGKIVIGGRFLDAPEACGLYIFTVDSVEEAIQLTAADPEIQAGRLVFDFHRWQSTDGLQVGLPNGFDI